MGESSSDEARAEPGGWVDAAFSDEYLVAEILMRLSKARVPPDPAPLQWGLRLPRSRQTPKSATVLRVKEEEEATRASPTTPLSWSGGSSPSGDVCEQSSRSGKRRAGAGPVADSVAGTSDDARSKVVGNKANHFRLTVRTKKKKTFAELKEEENLLLMDRVNLNKDLDHLQATCKELREKNESLMKLKLNLESRSAVKTSSIPPDPPHPVVGFELPDLNLLPLEEEPESSGFDTLYGIS